MSSRAARRRQPRRLPLGPHPQARPDRLGDGARSGEPGLRAPRAGVSRSPAAPILDDERLLRLPPVATFVSVIGAVHGLHLVGGSVLGGGMRRESPSLGPLEGVGSSSPGRPTRVAGTARNSLV